MHRLTILKLVAISIVVSAALLALPRAGQAATISYEDGADLRISLFTIGPGSEVNTFFGHNGLLIEDTRRGLAILYHYGLFSFGPDMLARYMMGRLEFSTGRDAASAAFEFYEAQGRDITLARLNLPAAKRLAIAQRVEHDLLPEYRDYVYHHYFANCSTKVRDLLDEMLDGQLRAALGAPARLSFREHTRRYAEVNPVVNLALILWMNDEMERPILEWNETFLPDVLNEELADFRYVDESGAEVPLVDQTRVVYQSPRPPTGRDPAPLLPYTLPIGLVTAGFALLLGRRALGCYQALAGLVYGVPGLLLFLMATFTEHSVTFRNENLWFCNALTFLALPTGLGAALGWRSAQTAARWIWTILAAGGVLALVLKVLPSFDQDNWIVLALIVPLNIAMAIASRSAQTSSPKRAKSNA